MQVLVQSASENILVIDHDDIGLNKMILCLQFEGENPLSHSWDAVYCAGGYAGILKQSKINAACFLEIAV